MRRGCCLGGIVLVLVLFGLLYAAGYYIGNLGLLVPAPRADTAAAVPGVPALVLRFDTRGAEAFRIFQEGTRGLPAPVVSAVLPFEASLGVTREPEEQRLLVTWAVSLRRLGGIFAERVEPADWRPLEVLEQPVLLRQGEGLLVSRSYFPLRPDAAPEEAAPAARERLELTGGHNMELMVDNRDGGAFSALQPWVQAWEAGKDGPPRRLGPEIKAPPLAELLRGALAPLQSLHLVADLMEEDTADFQIRASASDAQAAESALLYLMMLQDWLFQELIQQDMLLLGELEQAGAEITGRLSLSGFSDVLIQHLRGILS